jgi:hypothetical protein
MEGTSLNRKGDIHLTKKFHVVMESEYSSQSFTKDYYGLVEYTSYFHRQLCDIAEQVCGDDFATMNCNTVQHRSMSAQASMAECDIHGTRNVSGG